MIKNISRLALMGAMLSPATLFAMGLGEIHLRSALNQPFDAEIELVSATPEELPNLKIVLASADTFARYGLDKPQFLSNFNFRVGRSEDGKPIIRVTSSSNVAEPFVTLLVEANWPSGHIVREYTVLLDPPVYMPGEDKAAAPVAAPRAGAQANPAPRVQQSAPASQPGAAAPPVEQAAPPPRPSRPAPRYEAPAAAAPSEISGDSYEVRRNDTLSKIAARLHPGSSRTDLNRAMVGLYRTNPQAFAGNINVLRAGAVLRLPAEGVDAVNGKEANAEMAKQYESWNSSGGRLRLVTPPDSGAPSADAAAAAAAAKASADAKAAQERAAQAQAAQAAESKRLLDIKNAELARLQQQQAQQAAKTPAPTPAPAPTPPVSTSPPVDAPVAQAPTPEPAPTAEPTPAPTPEPAPATAQKAPVPAVATEPADNRSIFERYSFLFIGAGLIVLLVALFAYFRKRREPDLDEIGDRTFVPSDFSEPPPTRRAPAVVDEGTGTFEVQEAMRANDTSELQTRRPAAAAAATAAAAGAAAAAAVSAAKPAKNADDTMSSDTAVHFDQQDALAEADFHMAYGLYDQAADLVKIAIEREPARRDLKMKLLEIYFVWGNRELFLDTARQLHSTQGEATASEWDKVLIMGKQITPDDPMFSGAVSARGAAEFVDVNLEGGENRVDIDLFEPPAAEQAPHDTLAVGDNDATQIATRAGKLDFLLDEPQRGTDEDSTQEITREMDSGARTQETPTIESPRVDRSGETIREKVERKVFSEGLNPEHTAEVAIDDLGLDVHHQFEETTLLPDDDNEITGDVTGNDRTVRRERPIDDDEMTRVAEHGRFGKDREANLDSTAELRYGNDTPEDGTSTIFIEEQPDFENADDTREQLRVSDVDSTSRMKAPKIDLDLDRLSGEEVPEGDTIKRFGEAESDTGRFAADVFGDNSDSRDIDALLGGDSREDDTRQSPTARTEVLTSALQEIEPVTMSEVGTKLDLARAYMDMGDPDGARSILEEVLAEGNGNQKQEAQRLLDSIR
jgi:pilus assembly protein FimV